MSKDNCILIITIYSYFSFRYFLKYDNTISENLKMAPFQV